MSTGRVFVSTGSFGGAPADAVTRLISSGVNEIELSGGTPDEGLADALLAFRGRATMQLHNYFPPADPPFVFNLASTSGEIRERTLDCMSDALALSAQVGAQRYSVHAGFLVDPPVAYLGATWRTLERADLDEAHRLFVDSVVELKDRADRFGIALLVENNVLTVGTRDQCGDDVLLMASGQQICDLMEQLPAGVGLLMDAAHLKVTAATLGFDPMAVLKDVASYTQGYHLSDNDGMSDSNRPVTADSWFWKGLDPNVDFATLEVSPADGTDLYAQVELTDLMWTGGGAR